MKSEPDSVFFKRILAKIKSGNEKDELVMCRRIEYGNKIEYYPLSNPSRYQIKNLLLKIIRMKNGKQ